LVAHVSHLKVFFEFVKSLNSALRTLPCDHSRDLVRFGDSATVRDIAGFRLDGGLDGRPERLAAATFSAVGALEVQHIERWLRRNPELLGEEFRVIASQFSGFDGTRDRPDLLALDRNGKLVAGVAFRSRVA
jgi:hypothetical protein